MHMQVTNAGARRPAPPSPGDIRTARELARRWGWLLAGGIVSVVAGLAILSIRWSVGSLAVFVGIVFVVRGVSELATSSSRAHRGLAIVSGVSGLLVGVLAIAWPAPTLFVIATFTGIWLSVWGVIAAIGSIVDRGPLWGLTLAAGIAAVPLGVWALAHPGATLAVLVAAVGIWTVMAGLTEVIAAFELRRLPEDLEAARDAMTTVDVSTPVAAQDLVGADR